MLSDKYGWTPKQIREQRFEDMVLYIDIIKEKQNLEKYYQKKYGRK